MRSIQHWARDIGFRPGEQATSSLPSLQPAAVIR
jgi:hypothetical protein